MTTLPPTPLTVGPSQVIIGEHTIDGIGAFAPVAAQRILLIHSGKVPEIVGRVKTALSPLNRHLIEGIVPDGEAAKTVATANELWRLLGHESFTRTDLIVAVGGGTITDLGGWVAASWLRGTAIITVPTTVLAMVDAAIGGKCGINTNEGKNLVGAFHDPLAVICDTTTLTSLPAGEFSSGMAEIIKAGLIADPTILDLLRTHPDNVRKVTTRTQHLIQRAITAKATIVATDRYEKGPREALNYGHTLGHAIEHHSKYTIRHGEAIAIGMIFAAELAHRSGYINCHLLARHRALLTEANLPTTYRGGTLEELLPLMHRDKKTRGDALRFVILDGIASTRRLTDPPRQLLDDAFGALVSGPSRQGCGSGAAFTLPPT